MNSSEAAANTIKLTDVSLVIQVDGNPINMDQFKQILESENSITGFRTSMENLAQRLDGLESQINDCDSGNSAQEIFGAFWDAISNVSIDLSDYVSPGVSEDDYYNSDLTYIRENIQEIKRDIDRLLNRG